VSESIGPGDYVECLRPVGEKGRIETIPGNVYRVRDVGEQGGGVWLSIVGIPDPNQLGYPCPGWGAEAFRPIYRPKAELIASLKQPSPELEPIRVLEDEVAEAAAFLIALIPQVYR
jgi:hypothetical protein